MIRAIFSTFLMLICLGFAEAQSSNPYGLPLTTNFEDYRKSVAEDPDNEFVKLLEYARVRLL